MWAFIMKNTYIFQAIHRYSLSPHGYSISLLVFVISYEQRHMLGFDLYE